MNDCLFCKIVKGEIPSYTVYEDEKVKVFLDINPNNDGHLLEFQRNIRLIFMKWMMRLYFIC